MVFTRKRCEGFHFQPFTRFTGHGVARGRVWKLGRQCEGLKSPTLHNGKQWKSAGNEQSVNGWTVFSGINSVYIYTREGKKQWNFHGHSKTDTMTSPQPQPHPHPRIMYRRCRPGATQRSDTRIRDFAWTSPGLFFTTRRLEKTSPGLVKRSLRLGRNK